jgi:hypothetical protein
VLGPIVHRTPITRGSHPACAVCAPTFVLGAPFCEANDQGPRPGRWPSPSLGSASRSASRLPSTALPRCLEFASTTDVSRHEHPSETPPPETTRRPPWETPPAFDFEILLARGVSAVRARKTPDHLAVIQPPAATCLTARRRLQVVQHSLALPRDALSRAEREQAQKTVRAFSAIGQPRRSEPSDTSHCDRGRQSKPRVSSR